MTSRRVGALLFLVLFAGLAEPVRADHPSAGFGTGVAGPVLTISAATLPESHWAFGTRVEYVRFDTFTDAELEGFAEADQDVHSVETLVSPFVTLSYGLTDDVTLGIRVPYVLRSDVRDAHLEGGVPEVHRHGDSKGIGDVVLIGQSRWVQRERWQSAVILGVKAPTGQTHVSDDEGERFETEHQPGSGSWDVILGAAVSLPSRRWSLDTNVLGTFTSEGAEDIQLGTLVNYNAALTFRPGGQPVHDDVGGEGSSSESAPAHEHHDPGDATHGSGPVFDLVLEANGEWHDRDQHLGADKENTGGNLVYLSPGIRVGMGEGWGAAVSVGFPVLQDLNGSQHETDLRLVAGFGVTF